MVSFENFVKSMTPSLLELKVTPSFCFAFKIPDGVTATNKYGRLYLLEYFEIFWEKNSKVGSDPERLIYMAQFPGRLFSPSATCKKMSYHFLLHFSIGMGF
jgi:hypothetical protein